MKTMKRLLALFLCLVMVCSLVPMQAFATETETDSEIQTTEVSETEVTDDVPVVEDTNEENLPEEGTSEDPAEAAGEADEAVGAAEEVPGEADEADEADEPVAPAAPDRFGKNVINPLLTVICDSDPARHAPVTGKWYSQSCKVYPANSTPVWDEELGAWTIGVRLQSLVIYYVDELKDAYNNINHELADGVGSVENKMIVTTLKWDAAQELWVPTEALEVHATCQTAPVAPVHNQLKSYQIKVHGDLDGDGVYGESGESYTTSIPDGSYVVGEVKGSREEGFTVDVTVTLEHGDDFIGTWIKKRASGEDYIYNWDKTPETVTFTLTYNGSLTGTLYGNRHGSNNYDWILGFNAKGQPLTYGAVGDAYVGKKATVTYTDGVEDAEVFADQVHTVAVGSNTPAYEGTPERAGYAFKGWTPEVAETVTETEVTYTAKWAPYQTVNVVIYRNGDTTTPYKTVSLDKVPLGDAFDVSALNIADYYSSTYGFEFEGWYNDGGWNSYKAGNKGNTLPEEITINGWTNIVCMVTDYQKVIVYGVTNGDKDNAEVVFNGTALKGLNLVSWLDANVAVPEKTGYTVDKWYNWDWYGHKYDDARTVNGWTNVYVTYTANQYTLTLDPAGGKVDPATVTVTYDAAIGELPAATRSGYIFDGWVDAEGKAVTAETVYTVAGDSTITAKWIRHPGSSSGNVTKELFTIQCDTNGEHKWVVNWLGSHVNLVKDSVKWDEANGRWTAQATFSQFSLMNNSVTRKNYFGGITHHYEDGLKITMDLYYDPNFTGLNSQNKVVTGMWLPVEDYVAHVYCYDKPSMPDVSKASGNAIWVRDAGNKNASSATRYTIKQLIDGTYTLGEMYTENGKFYVKLTINDLSAYIDALEAKNGKSYAIGNWQYHNTLEDCVFTLVYTGSTTDYKQDGTGWSVDASSYASNSEKMNGKSLWLTEQYTVTYTDGVEDKEVFADQVFVVNLYSENGGTKNSTADFTLNNATPTVDDPARAGYIFNGWNPEVAETITEDVTYTAQWIRHPGSGSGNVTKELFTIQCDTNGEHKWVVNWLGSHVNLVKDSVKWDEANNRWVAQATFSQFSLMNSTVTRKNYFGGITHHYEDGLKITMDLYYDPNFTGLNSQKKEVTGMWLPVQKYVVDVYCYTAPAMPDVSKISDKALWVRDTGNRNATHSIKFTIKQLVEGTYTLSDMYTENGKFYVDLTITNVAPYLEALEAKTGVKYVVGEWEKHYTVEDLKFTLVYTGSTTDYKQDGTGWKVDATSYPTNQDKLNGMSLWVTTQYTVTYTDGVEDKEVFADQVFIVNAYTENGATKNATTDFSVTATPTVEDPTRPGYFFRGWTPEVAETVTGDVTYTAVWELIELKVYYTIDGTLVNEFTLTGVDVTAFNVYEYMPEKEGYTLDCWYEKAADIGNPYKAEPNADQDFTYKKVLRLYGSYVANEYTVSYNTNGGPAAESKVVTFGAKYGRLPSSAITGLSSRKNDWYLVDENGDVTDVNIRNTTAVSVARDHTLFLMRDVLAPTPKITLTVPGAISDDYKYYVPGASERVLTVTVNNMNEEILSYTYAWYKDGVLIEGATESVLTLPGNVSDSGTYKVVVTATLKDGTGIVVNVDTASGEKEQKVQIMHAANTLYYDANGGEGGPSNNFTGGTEITVQSGEPTRVGYTFAGWNTAADGTGDSYVAGDTYTFVDDNGNGGCQVTLYAQWTANTYTVTLDPNGGKIDSTTVEVTYDQPVGELPVPTKEGYTFAGWVDGDGNKVTEETVYTLTDDATLIATWTVNTYTVTLDANGGKVDPASIEVTYGTAIGELPVPTKEGYTFAGWVDKDGNKVTEETVYNLTANATLTAQWTANTYTVTLDPNGGKIDSTTVEVTYDQPVGKLPTPTKEGYTFTGWVDKDGNKVTDKTVYSVAGDSTLKATWQKTVVKDPTSPDTGDAGITAMLTICALSGALLVILVSQKKRLFR